MSINSDPLLSKFKSNQNMNVSDDSMQIEAVSFTTMVKWLLWKNMKSQCQRRKKSWATKMLIPILFTLILALLRKAFPIKNEPVDYGSSINSAQSINATTTSNAYWAGNTLCDNSTDNAAFLISIVPPYGTNSYIDQVIDKLNKSWLYNPTKINVNQRCINYINTLPFKEGWTVKYFGTDSAVDNYCKKPNYGKQYNVTNNINDKAQQHRPIGFGITFDVPTESGKYWSYKLRFNGSGGPNGVPAGQGPPSYFTSQFPVAATNQNPINNFNRQLQDQWLQGSSNYVYSSFINVQSFVDNAIMEVIAGLDGSADWNTVNTTIKTMTKGFWVFPTAAYETDSFWTTLQPLFVFFIIIIFVYPFSVIVKSLVEEKESKIKEGLKMMGATVGAWWASWYVWFLCEFILMAICFTFIGKWTHVFLYSDVSVIFVWMVLFVINLVTYATLISTLFDNPKIGSLISIFMFVLALYGGFFGPIFSGAQKKTLCLLGPACYSISLANLAQYEASLIGLHWDNIGDEYQDFAFSTCIWMLLLDSIGYFLLTLYLDRVFPSRFGQRLPPFFVCVPSFWCPKRMKRMSNEFESIDRSRKYTLQTTESFESLPSSKANVDPAISIRKLTKHFTSFLSQKMVKAVNGISLDIYGGEVFCLLGHNGAGKTTTISMLTGLLEMTSGNAWILNNSIKDQNGMKTIRKSLGVCPQHDVLFKRLTVREHLELFSRLKGVPSKYIKQEVDKTIESVGMKEKENDFPPNISGGQKRKLSLGIALIGGSKIVFLDEPTSGMDPASRRVTWDLISKEKKKRCIILTTHFMDEADILADRIAIMSGGFITCCGSSLFLKRLYGVGYTFTISLQIGTDGQRTKIDSIVLKSIKGSSILTEAGAEISYRLPFEETANFPHVFEELDRMKSELNISNYGISITTLEEVFLKIGELQLQNEEDNSQNEISSSSNLDPFADDTGSVELKQKLVNSAYTDVEVKINGDRSSMLEIEQSIQRHQKDYEKMEEIFPQPTFQLQEQSEFRIFLEHFYAILYRRFYWGIRDFRALSCQILLPAFFAAIGLVLLKISQTVDNPSLVLSTEQFYGANAGLNGYKIPFSNITGYDGLLDNEWTDTYSASLSNKYGKLEPVSLSNSALSNVTEFQDWLLHNFEADSKYHYNAFWTADGDNSMQLGVNATAVHSVPIVYNLANNWILKQMVNVDTSITISSEPLVITMNEKAISDSVSGVFAAIFLMIAFAFIPVGAVYNIIMDKRKLTKHQQFVSGMSYISYWVGNFIADFIAAIPAMILVYFMVLMFDIDVYSSAAAQGPFILILISFTLSILPFTYILSYLFSSPEKAQTVIATLYLMLGMILLIVSFVLDQINDSTEKINKHLSNIYRIFPTYLVSDGLFKIAIKPAMYADESYFKWDIIGRDITLMIIECIGYFMVVLLIEYVLASPNILDKFGLIYTDTIDESEPQIVEDSSLDEDVTNEMERIQRELDTGDIDDTVMLEGLRKVYKGTNGKPPNVAVRNIYFGVPQGEVFGYLGVNGAGKTSTLACLTGERFKSGGNAYINGISIENQIQCRRYIGYTPQFDALFDLLTAKEHLRFYGMLKGLTGKELKDQTDLLIRVLDLTKYRNRTAGTYSGGNKRKLSVAIAMIGNPPVILLDEPSTGMDPLARRQMWEFIKGTMNGRCVLLTTHSMEECEALCQRLAIMVKGQLQCIGSPQHLKNKFGEGYQLDITLSDDEQKTYVYVEQELKSQFSCELIERNQAKVTYQLNNENNKNSLAEVFQILEECKGKLPIISYALNQTTLEQIFIRMAKENEAISEI